jgi:hypothetical protein
MHWRDLEEVAAEERVLRGESLLVLGIAGTGKTHYVQGIAEHPWQPPDYATKNEKLRDMLAPPLLHPL